MKPKDHDAGRDAFALGFTKMLHDDVDQLANLRVADKVVAAHLRLDLVHHLPEFRQFLHLTTKYKRHEPISKQ